jgi:hypothetical protein
LLRSLPTTTVLTGRPLACSAVREKPGWSLEMARG